MNEYARMVSEWSVNTHQEVSCGRGSQSSEEQDGTLWTPTSLIFQLPQCFLNKLMHSVARMVKMEVIMDFFSTRLIQLASQLQVQPATRQQISYNWTPSIMAGASGSFLAWKQREKEVHLPSTNNPQDLPNAIFTEYPTRCFWLQNLFYSKESDPRSWYSKDSPS